MVNMDALIDNTVLSNFAVIHGEDLLNRIVEGILFTAQEVLEELEIGENRRVIPKRDWSWIQVLRLDTAQEHMTFTTLRGIVLEVVSLRA